MGTTSERPVVWVTGGAGYIGSNVVRELIHQNRKPVVIDSFITGTKRFIPTTVPYMECDITQESAIYGALNHLLAAHGPPQAIIHLAAESDVRMCENYADQAYGNNVIGTYNIASFAAHHDIKNFIFASSAAVYGDRGTKKADTDWQGLEPVGVYGTTKLDAEKMLQTYFKNSLQTTILRLFNVAGAGCGDQINVSPRGKPSAPNRPLIPMLVKAYLSESSITLRERQELFFNYSPVRDFIHVRDVAAALTAFAGLRNPAHYSPGPYTLNVGRGIPVKISDLLEFMKFDKQLLSARVDWQRMGKEEIFYSVAGDVNFGKDAKHNLANMWLDEVRWQKSKLYNLIKNDHPRGV